MKKLLVIIPTYNEASNIGTLVSEIFLVSKKVPQWTFEVLVVDDNSPDGSADIVRKMQSRNRKLHLLTGPKTGYGKAYLRGFDWALSKKTYDAFLMMDADFSHDPKAIPSLLKAIDNGADYVIGSRYVNGGVIAEDWSLIRGHMSRGANWFAHLLVGTIGVTDFTGGFKAIRYSALKELNLSNIRASGYVFQVNLLHEFSHKGFKITEVPITFRNRQAGVSKMRWQDVIEFIYLTYRLNPESRVRRLVRFGFVGAGGTVVNLVVISTLIRIFHWAVLPADAIAIETSIVSNFLLNYFYTFRASITSPSKGYTDTVDVIILKLLKFNTVMFGGASISFIIFSLSYKLLGLTYLTADLIGIVAAMGLNYWLNVRVIWGLVDD